MRRPVLGSILSVGVSLFTSIDKPAQNFTDLKDVAHFLCTNTPECFRDAVRNSGGRFLYRGDSPASYESTSSLVARVYSPEPDLLLPGTYPADDALIYFQCLELQLKEAKAKPSTGHMGTSILTDAALWGDTVVSVWPVGNSISYVWPRDTNTFYPASQCPVDSLIIDSGLVDALQKGREVLFSSWDESAKPLAGPTSSFLAVPSRYDQKLRTLLKSLRYGL